MTRNFEKIPQKEFYSGELVESLCLESQISEETFFKYVKFLRTLQIK